MATRSFTQCPLDKVKIMYVEGVGKREVATVLSCEDFNDITTKGSVVVTEKHGTFLKVTDQHWVTVNRFESCMMLTCFLP